MKAGFQRVVLAAVVAVLTACGTTQEGAVNGDTTAVNGLPAGQPATPGMQVAVQCAPSEGMPVEGRASPYDSATVQLGDTIAKVCYGRPSARGRTIFGELVPYDQLWRTGANEPTIIHTPVPVEIAGIAVEPGSYSIYTVPGVNEWEVIVNRSTSQWGIESQYTEEIRAQEVGRATVPSGETGDYVEQFTIRSEPAAGDATELVLEWEDTQVAIPVERTE